MPMPSAGCSSSRFPLSALPFSKHVPSSQHCARLFRSSNPIKLLYYYSDCSPTCYIAFGLRYDEPPNNFVIPSTSYCYHYPVPSNVLAIHLEAFERYSCCKRRQQAAHTSGEGVEGRQVRRASVSPGCRKIPQSSSGLLYVINAA
jgi:hypothetical protein